MDSLISAVIIPLVGSGMVLGGLLSISIFQLPTIRRNMRREAVEQIYARIMDARMRLENNETFTNMAKESSIFADRFAVVDTPQEYYTVMSFIDLIEFLYGLNKTNMINAEVWSRWKSLSRTMMTIPKFKKVWDKTRIFILLNSEILLTPYDFPNGSTNIDLRWIYQRIYNL